MIARTHDVAALVALTGYLVWNPPEQVTIATLFTAFLANQLGGIVPDIDQPTAPFWRNLPVGRYAGRVFGALVGGHRFLCHSLIGLVLFGVLSNAFLEFLYPIIPNVAIRFVWVAFMIGMISHLVLDSLTKEGVPWLLPLPVKFGFPPLRAWRLTTGKWVEEFVLLPLLVVAMIWLCNSHYALLSDIFVNRLIR